MLYITYLITYVNILVIREEMLLVRFTNLTFLWQFLPWGKKKKQLHGITNKHQKINLKDIKIYQKKIAFYKKQTGSSSKSLSSSVIRTAVVWFFIGYSHNHRVCYFSVDFARSLWTWWNVLRVKLLCAEAVRQEVIYTHSKIYVELIDWGSC